MGTEFPNDSNGSTPTMKENELSLSPVKPDESGEGLPYAPANWPKPGDNWIWRVGKRVAITGHFLDRYLYLPKRLSNRENSSRKGYGFASKLSLERYIKKTFPDADVDAFFASFSWRIPAQKSSSTNGIPDRRISFPLPSGERTENAVSDSLSDIMGCKAGNKNCSSLLEAENQSLFELMPCNICCSEPQFCRDCCCILCSMAISSTHGHGGYSYIRCEAVVDEDYICGHLVHIDCALRCYMAGTVGGSIGLDAEYYCRRCDARTDLVSHVQKLLRSCESIESQNDIEKILGVGVCILRGSQKSSAKELLSHIELAIAKLKSGSYLEDIWKMEDKFSSICTANQHFAEQGNTTLEVSDSHGPCPPDTVRSSEWGMSISFDYQTESLRLDEEIDQVLQALRKSQEIEFKLAEERLQTQKTFLQNLYKQLDQERSDLARRTSTADPDDLLNTVLDRVNQIKREMVKLKNMEKVASGFGKTSKEILKEAFGLEHED